MKHGFPTLSPRELTSIGASVIGVWLMGVLGACDSVDETDDSPANGEASAPDVSRPSAGSGSSQRASCQGRCGDFDASESCQCDDQCVRYNDCCSDLERICNGGGDGDGGGGDGGGGDGDGGGGSGGQRIIAVADVHGDVAALEYALELSGLMSAGGIWTGGDTIFVQTGDQLDRGADELAILNLLDDLAAQAPGQVYVLNGNHEILNVELDFRYVDRDSDLGGPNSSQRENEMRPGGKWARRFAQRPNVLVLHGNVFVHGGLESAYVNYQSVNSSIRSWMNGNASEPAAAYKSDGPLWSRAYSDSGADCSQLNQVLSAVGADRMVVGHTIQNNVNSACGGKIWRLDVGMSYYYGEDKIGWLEIEGDTVTPHTVDRP
ncbi:MAG: hypothetical protein B7733_03905 [Myxococcales bacterium FL481]|nr:MAG: hypothetical protein B7733_03905 [Myxococcales bacterium FL481]